MLGQAGRSGSVGVVALGALSAAVLLSAVGVAAFRDVTAGVDTVLQRGTDAVLVMSDGRRRPAVQGEAVPGGATVEAGRSGAVLATADREVHLYPAASVTVLDGLRQVLTAGSVIVDASDAPGLDLDTAAAAVSTRDGALVRVDGGPLTRIGVLSTPGGSGAGADVRATGRRAATEVSEYYQVQVATGALPGATTPLLLTGDDYELALARDLVLADRTLNQIRRTLVGTAVEGRAVLTALRSAVPDGAGSPSSVPDTERALAFLVASSTSGGSQSDRFARVSELRSAGGSWGVVAAIVGATVDAVGAQLARLLAPAAELLAVEQQPVDVAQALGLVPPPPPAPVAAATLKVPVLPPPSSSTARRSGPVAAPAPSPSPQLPAPLPTVPPAPTEPVAVVLEGVVDAVLNLVDLGSAPTSPAPQPVGSPSPLLDLPLLKLPLLP